MLRVNQRAGFGIEGPYSCLGADFDGTNDYMETAAALTGLVDGKKGLFSCWVRLDGGDGVQGGIFGFAGVSGQRFFVSRQDTNVFRVLGDNSAGATVLTISSTTTYTAGATWRHLLASWDLATAGARHLYVNDVSDLTVGTFTNDTIDYVQASANKAVIGRTPTGFLKIDGCLAEVFFDQTYLDLSVTANRRKFISARGRPVNLGPTGKFPTGSALAYQSIRKSGAVTDFATNRIGAGNFTISGSLDLSSTNP